MNPKKTKTHTPTRIKADLAIVPDDGIVIELTANDGAETIGYATTEENAAFIVRAVNNHEALLETLKSARRELSNSTRYDYIDKAIAAAEKGE